jgi:hypothetical protein
VGEAVAVDEAGVAEHEPLGRVEGGGVDVGHAATVGPGSVRRLGRNGHRARRKSRGRHGRHPS